MSQEKKGIFDRIQKETNIRPEEIYRIAASVKNADFSNEQTVRNLVQQISSMAGKRISSEKEKKIVESITNNKIPDDVQGLNRLFKQ
ncbi:stage VI sporulation protein F [Ornithinibacillus sp. 4-3]|uniref:Stage VI sporulation protein F n=1 Tax=Ornithinibacillus sp. 4-3 TaxID=3231488 RepID=A0AB39HL24_9BACI